MLPHFTLTFFGHSLEFITSDVLYSFAFVLALVLTPFILRKEIKPNRSLWMVFATAVFALLGGRLFHVVWERPAFFFQHPSQMLGLDGLVLYGAVFAGLGTLAGFTRREPSQTQHKVWDLAAIEAGLFIGILRISCFCEGCCWGLPTRVKWAVRFTNPESLMPWLGIPVHPTQLYESAAGFLICASLLALRKVPALSGRLIFLFCIEYGIARFVIEFYRGDSFRGVGLFLGLSTSQLISVAMVIAASLALLIRGTELRTEYAPS